MSNFEKLEIINNMKLSPKITLFKSTLIIILMVHSSLYYGQYYEDDSPKKEASEMPKSFKERLYYGGNLSFNIFNNYLFFDIAPIVGYKITEKFSVGLGTKYLFIRDMTFKINNSIYGGSVFTRYKVLPQFFLHAEYEVLNAYNRVFTSPNYGKRDLANMGFVGLGYASGNGFGFQAMLLYDLIDHVNSPYQDSYILGYAGPPLVLRIGFTLGF